MKKGYFLIIMFCLLISSRGYSQVGTICHWDNNRSAAVCLTFDDWSPGQYPIAVFDLKDRGLTGTFFPVGSNQNWSTLVESAGYGHEFGNHTQTHPDLTTVSSSELVTEVEGMKNILDQHITSQKCLTLAYPGCNYNQTVINEVKSSGHIGARTCGALNFSWDFASTDDDYYKIGAYGMDNNVSLSTFQSQVNSVISGGGLLTFMYHSLDDGSTYGDNWFAQVQKSNFDAQLDYLVSVKNTVWVTTFTKAIKYHREVRTATLSEVSTYDGSTWVVKLTHTLDNSLYNLPLSIRLNTNGVNYTSVSQNGSSITIDSNSNDVIMFRAIPNGGNITLSSSGGGCTPTPITPYIQVDGGSWQQTASVSLNTGSSVMFSPQPATGGSWSWSGPNGFTAFTRDVYLSNIQTNQAGDYVATYTNDAGCQSTQLFTVSVTSSGGGATTTYVQSIITGTESVGKGSKRGTAMITIYDDLGNVVSGATVTGTFSGSFNETVSGITDSNGTVVIATSGTAKGNVSVDFCVDNVTHSSLTYASTQNVITCTGAAAGIAAIATDVNSIKDEDLINYEIYPNPTSDGIFNITFPGIKGTVTIGIYDIQGKLLYKQSVAGKEHMVVNTKLVKGLYLVKVQSETSTIIKRLVVKN